MIGSILNGGTMGTSPKRRVKAKDSNAKPVLHSKQQQQHGKLFHMTTPGHTILRFAVYIMVLIGVGIFLAFGEGLSLRADVMADIVEIESMMDSLTVSYDEQMIQLRAQKANMTPQQSHKILVVGMIEVLQDLHENRPVVVPINSLCWAYQQDGEYPDRHGSVHVHVLYQRRKRNPDDITDTTDYVEELETDMQRWGCQTTFVEQESLWHDLPWDQLANFNYEFARMSRYGKMSRLRSIQRKSILENKNINNTDSNGNLNYDIVINVDLDIVKMPAIPNVITAMDQISINSQGVIGDALDGGSGSIICANGYERWKIRNVWNPDKYLDFHPLLFYDTMAAVDEYGEWLYSKYTLSAQQNVMFGQTSFLADILRQKRNLKPMRSCFGGLAIYDFASWAYPGCDYERKNIQLLMKHDEHHYSDDVSASSSGLLAADVEKQLRSVVKEPLVKEPPAKSLFEHLQQQRWTMDGRYTVNGKPDGDACEHTVFQQCLYDASTSRAMHPSRPLRIGIQPDILIQREAAILSRDEDIARLWRIVRRVIWILVGIAVVGFEVLRRLGYIHFDYLRCLGIVVGRLRYVVKVVAHFLESWNEDPARAEANSKRS